MSQKALTVYAAFVTVLLCIVSFFAFKKHPKLANVDEITVKKINIIGEDGKLRMVISNEAKQHSGEISGRDFPRCESGAGILYYNRNGDECEELDRSNAKDIISPVMYERPRWKNKIENIR